MFVLYMLKFQQWIFFGKLISTHKIEKSQNTCTNKHLNVNYFGTISDLTVNFKGFVCGHL